MLSANKLKNLIKAKKMSTGQLADPVVRGGLNKRQAIAAINNWQNGLFRPEPRKEDIRNLATALSADINDISNWRSTCQYAPFSARKARLVSNMIVGLPVQDAMDLLKFTHKRAAGTIDKVLKTAVADADEQQADVDKLIVSEARVDDAGVRIGTKRWIPKDRGRAHPLRKKACHVHVTVAQSKF